MNRSPRSLTFGAALMLVFTAGCTKTNQPPHISSLTATPDTVAAGGTCMLRATVTDADNDSVSFNWQASVGTLTAAGADSVIWTAPATEGVYAVSVVASDGRASDARNVAVSVGRVPKFQVCGWAHHTETSYGNMFAGHFVQVMSDPLIATATVTVEGQQLQPYPKPLTHARVFYDTVSPTPGTANALSIESNLGNCTATCSIPGEFAFLTPTIDSIGVGDPLVMSWTAAAHAQWYQVFIDYYNFYWIPMWSKDTFFVASGESASVSGTWFTEDGYAELRVYAGNGPSPAAGANAPGNVTGDADGYWIGLNSIEKGITVGHFSLSQAARWAKDPDAQLRMLMESYTKH